jgi:hypothetical protein
MLLPNTARSQRDLHLIFLVTILVALMYFSVQGEEEQRPGEYGIDLSRSGNELGTALPPPVLLLRADSRQFELSFGLAPRSTVVRLAALVCSPADTACRAPAANPLAPSLLCSLTCPRLALLELEFGQLF